MTDISKKYQRLNPKEHVLKRPHMYIGSIDSDNYSTWIFDRNDKIMKKQTCKYIPGLYKIFDEILVNAIDHGVRLHVEADKSDGNKVHPLKTIKINVDREKGTISIFNDGNGIDVVVHPKEKVYIPELIFGNLLTSTNYDDDEIKTIGGQNGIGAKACNIFSEYFTIETVDHINKKQYKQTFRNNMTVIDSPEITKSIKKPYTIISFKPDYGKFKLDGLSDDMLAIMEKRAYDTAALTGDSVTVYLNGEKIGYKSFERYADSYLGTRGEHTRVYESINDNWEVIATYNKSGGFEQISFVNGIWTIRGGKHVDYIVNQITKKLSEVIQRKKKINVVKPQTIKDNLIVFIKSTITDPRFDSQSKETLVSPQSKFGSTAVISDKFIDKLYKTELVDRVLEISQLHNNKTLQKTDGKKRNTIRGIPKLDDANFAGTAKSNLCTLILTEGDSASSMAISGIGEAGGRDIWGVFPLKGKVMNVKDMTSNKIGQNEEINNLKKILGLESGKTYNSLDTLRYGKIMLLTDQDYDGSHIKGLLFNLFHSLWPSLLSINTFLTSMNTPIVKVFHGNDQIPFYNLTDFENWKINNSNRNYKVKYYKGLGTSTNVEAKSYFKNMRSITYKYDENSNKSLELAFNKKLADDRKSWLSNYDKQSILDYKDISVTYDRFINYDLIHFSNYDLQRSIPSLCDGFKPSQRKILYSCFKRNLYDKEIRVAQLSGYISEKAGYHHGEVSLQGAIIGMAQDYVGSNNINLLKPNGQFGTRINGGKDAGASRYIHTLLENITGYIYKKEDEIVLDYNDDDGMEIEPQYYVPIIPMILINGAIGIGTGFSTTIPEYNPKDIINYLLSKIAPDKYKFDKQLIPWYKGFNGTIEWKDNKWISRGVWKRLSPVKIEITELPIGYWTMDFKVHLEELMDKNGDIKSYESYYTDTEVKFILLFQNEIILDKYLEKTDKCTKLDNELKLVTTRNLSITNMYLFNEKCQIEKFSSPEEIIDRFYIIRLDYYSRRKSSIVCNMEQSLRVLQNKTRFLQEVIDDKILVHKNTRKSLEEILEKSSYMKVDDKYAYLMEIPIYNLTSDRLDKLRGEMEKLESEMEKYKSTSIEMIWMGELLSLQDVYDKFVESPKKKMDKVLKKMISLRI